MTDNPVLQIRLVCSDVVKNNNKFWFCDVAPDGTQTRRWGRVGGNGTTKVFPFASYDKAVAVAEKEAEKRRNYKGSKAPYRDIEVLGTTNISSINTNDLAFVATQQIDTGGSKDLEKLIKFLVKRNVHKITSSTNITFSGGQLQTPLGPITPGAVKRARCLLDKLTGFVKRKLYDEPVFIGLVNDYLMIVPTHVRGKLDVRKLFPDLDAISEQSDILDAMAAVTVTSTPAGRTFSVKMDEVDDKTFSRIKTLYRKTRQSNHTSYGMKVKSAWAVDIETDSKAFDSGKGNVMELWHGTKASNLLSIFKQGLIIVPSSASHTTGRMFGNGLYFSDQSTKAANYATTFWGGKDEGRYFVLLCDVAMGRAYTPTGTRKTVPAGYDSTFAKAHKSGVYNNEMIVFRTDQACIRYLVELER